jgi:endoglucanase
LGFQRLERVVQWCARHGLYVILDVHAVQGWQNPHWHSDNANAVSLLWTHKHFQDRFVALWEELAKRYAGNPVIAGYDVMNEPFSGLPYGHDGHIPVPNWPSLNAVYRRAVQAIRAIDADHIIFVEGDNLGRRFSGLAEPFDGNVVASSHNYIPAAVYSGPYPGVFDGMTWDRAHQQEVFFQHEGTRYAQRHHVPLWVGEFGAMYNRPAAETAGHLKALDDQIDLFESYGAHWTTWTYKDIGVMGWVHLDPDSEYMRLVSHVLEAKREFHSDFSTQWLPPSATKQAADTLAQRIGQVIDDASLDAEETIRTISHSALQMHAGLMLQPAYASLFKDMSEVDIDRVLQSFAFKNCRVQQPLLEVVKGHMARPF